MSFHPEAEALRKPQRAAERGDGHHTRHILGASSLAAELLLPGIARLVAADGNDLPVVVLRKMVGASNVVRTCGRRR